jgi:hypothetical protein
MVLLMLCLPTNVSFHLHSAIHVKGRALSNYRSLPKLDMVKFGRFPEKNFFEKSVDGENIFRTHSVLATWFGTALLLVPQIFQAANPEAEFLCQQWSLFILAIAILTSQASSWEGDSKVQLARILCLMCSAETLLYLEQLITKFNIMGINDVIVSVSSLFVFAYLTYGYIVSGTTQINKLLPTVPIFNRDSTISNNKAD